MINIPLSQSAATATEIPLTKVNKTEDLDGQYEEINQLKTLTWEWSWAKS